MAFVLFIFMAVRSASHEKKTNQETKSAKDHHQMIENDWQQMQHAILQY